MASDIAPLVVVGAGPKAAALSAKSRVLREHGISAPPIYVVDNKRPAANWCGEHGFTSGSQRLGTPPEKDIGFPYQVDRENPAVTRSLFSEYSWLSFNIFAKKDFGEWIDRGRPHPTHREWAEYITKVLTKTADKICIGTIKNIEQSSDRWNIRVSVAGRIKDYVASGLVITGPGDRKAPPMPIPNHDYILYGDNFWSRLDSLNHIISGDDAPPIVVVGGGETSASIVIYLLEHFGSRKISILVLTRSGTIFSRGEGYYENRMFTEFETWTSLPSAVRREVIKRGDRGVFSIDAAKKLSLAHNIDHRFVEVKEVNISPTDRSIVVINKTIEAQMVIFGLGFDPFSFRTMFENPLKEVFSSGDIQKEIEENLNHDMSVKHSAITAKLYLPMIAAFSQGPGFPNLSCLGTLSDRILGRD